MLYLNFTKNNGGGPDCRVFNACTRCTSGGESDDNMIPFFKSDLNNIRVWHGIQYGSVHKITIVNLLTILPMMLSVLFVVNKS